MEKNTFVILSFVVLLAAENYYARVVQSYDEMELKRTYYVDGNLMDNKQIYDCNSELGVVFQKAKKSKVSIKLYFASDSGYTNSIILAFNSDIRLTFSASERQTKKMPWGGTRYYTYFDLNEDVYLQYFVRDCPQKMRVRPSRYRGASFLDFRVSQIQRNAFAEMANFYLNSLQK